MMKHEIVTNKQMAQADRRTIENGVPGFTLMQKAGSAAAQEIIENFEKAPVVILCGPGNNGGDGFVIADKLHKNRWPVQLACLVPEENLKGDAARAANLWGEQILSFDQVQIEKNTLVVDAVFGTGLSKPLEPSLQKFFKSLEGCKVIAIDIPSGISGDDGSADEGSLQASLTITFHRKKLGHVLYPGAGYCGDVLVRDIGITEEFEYEAIENHQEFWKDRLLRRKATVHKYHYGHALIYGAPELLGATTLAASACARIGAGLVTVLGGKKADIFRSMLPSHILVRDHLDWKDERINAKLYGTGGLQVQPDFKSDTPTVLDAEALDDLPGKLSENFILTPHEGEFSRIFPDSKGTKIQKAKKAARKTGAVLVYKGPDTVIAHPDGRCVVNTHSSPVLATAGTGDVLAGLITGLCAQGIDPFEASCASVWIHGEAGIRFGAGLVASDLPNLIPGILQDFA